MFVDLMLRLIGRPGSAVSCMLWSGRIVASYGLLVRLRNRINTPPNTSAARNAGRLVAKGQIISAKSNDVGTCEESHHEMLTA